MGGRVVGGLSTMFVLHLVFDEESIRIISAFWKTKKISNNPGHAATQMFEANTSILIIFNIDTVYHLPN